MNRRYFWIVIILLAIGVLLRYLVPDNSAPSYRDRDLSYNSGNAKRSSGGMLVYERQSSSVSGSETQSSDKTFVIDFGNRDLVVDGEDSNNVDKNRENVYLIQVDSNGRLLVNEKTRLAIERLHALSTPEELSDKLGVLPPDARQEVLNLVDYYDKYTKDLSQLSEKNERPDSVDEALSALDELHNQRIMYFGQDVAKVFFEKEEYANREMLELVYRERMDGI